MKKRMFMVATLAAAAFAVPAFAKDHGEDNGHGKGHGKGHEKQEEKAHREEVRQGAYFNDMHREEVRRYTSQHYGGGKGCPPGLAKKNNGCLPPGQARKWAVGQPVPAGVTVYTVPQPVLTMLPPPPMGYRYERLGGDIVLVHLGDRLVVDIMLNIF